MATETGLDLNFGVTGASGTRFAAAALRSLCADPRVDRIRLVVSDAAWDNLRAETGRTGASVDELRESPTGGLGRERMGVGL